jgi:tetratricopeptide (TPR) repeat protein
MSFNRISVGVLAIVVCIGAALACGPNFPWQLLSFRDRTVSERVELNFAFEASRLVSVAASLPRAVESWNTPVPEVVTSEQEEAQSGAWGIVGAGGDPAAWEAKLGAARGADNGEAALAAGAGLPVAVATYIAGAVEFGADRLESALRYFEAIDELPPDQRRVRAVAAAFMRGRVHQQLGQLEQARAAFQAARRHAEAGAPDPMGLAVASLGEEARLDLVEAGVIDAPWPVPAREIDDDGFARLMANAVRLYSEQAARGSRRAVLSLGEVARLLMGDEDDLKLAIADPLVRRMLVAYLASAERGYFEDGKERQGPDTTRAIEAVLSSASLATGPDLDRLASLAYQGGRYDLAERLVATTSQPLGLWVRAKLALRRGDREAAVRDWMAAFTATDQTDAASLDDESKTRLRGELAVMRLSQGAYRDSLQLLFPVADTYWGDVIYIAERVLTLDELKSFVDGLPPAPATPDKPDDDSWRPRPSPIRGLRSLLGRRLVRAGRTAEAVAYFPPAKPGATQNGERDGNRANADDVRGYIAAIEAARAPSVEWPWQKVSRGEALFRLATMTRVQGMGLAGTSGPPDMWQVYGSFPYGYGQASPNGMAQSPSPLLGPDEASRFAASAPKPDARFHYRAIAADRAMAAAELLPQRSQAYAATLCWAARYAIDSGDDDRATAIYKRYVATGAYQAWTKDFGRECVEPDFEAAKTFWQRRVTTWMKQMAGSAWRHSVLLATLAIAFGVVVLLGRRLLHARRPEVA